jgi:hypothetical protein
MDDKMQFLATSSLELLLECLSNLKVARVQRISGGNREDCINTRGIIVTLESPQFNASTRIRRCYKSVGGSDFQRDISRDELFRCYEHSSRRKFSRKSCARLSLHALMHKQ